MSTFSPEAQKIFEAWEDEELLDRLTEFHKFISTHKKETVEYGDPDEIEPKLRTYLNLELLQQVQLHRTEKLLLAIDPLILSVNAYGLALIVRGFYETTAITGYFCDRLEALALGNIEFRVFELNVADAVMGARHEQFDKARPPLNILTCIEKADRYFDKHYLKEKHETLQDSYSWLSDYAHPNFLSNVSAFTLDKETKCMVIRNSSELDKSEFNLVGYFGICSATFEFLFIEQAKRAASGILD